MVGGGEVALSALEEQRRWGHVENLAGCLRTEVIGKPLCRGSNARNKNLTHRERRRYFERCYFES